MWVILQLKYKKMAITIVIIGNFKNEIGDGGIIFLGMIILCMTVLIFEILGVKLCNTTFPWLSKIYNTGRKTKQN